jgi:Zn-finger nucleic acid-binding protein
MRKYIDDEINEGQIKRVICPRCYALVTEVEPEYQDRIFMPECPKCKHRFITGGDLDEDTKYTGDEYPYEKEWIDEQRKELKGRRFCVSDEGVIFTPTLQEIKKHGYRLVEDVSESELRHDDPDALNTMKRNLRDWKEMNALLESEDNKLEK